MEENRK